MYPSGMNSTSPHHAYKDKHISAEQIIVKGISKIGTARAPASAFCSFVNGKIPIKSSPANKDQNEYSQKVMSDVNTAKANHLNPEGTINIANMDTAVNDKYSFI